MTSKKKKITQNKNKGEGNDFLETKRNKIPISGGGRGLHV
jgi:hypothetical protein